MRGSTGIEDGMRGAMRCDDIAHTLSAPARRRRATTAGVVSSRSRLLVSKIEYDNAERILLGATR
jgi:hypothetical protein